MQNAPFGVSCVRDGARWKEKRQRAVSVSAPDIARCIPSSEDSIPGQSWTKARSLGFWQDRGVTGPFQATCLILKCRCRVNESQIVDFVKLVEEALECQRTCR